MRSIKFIIYAENKLNECRRRLQGVNIKGKDMEQLFFSSTNMIVEDYERLLRNEANTADAVISNVVHFRLTLARSITRLKNAYNDKGLAEKFDFLEGYGEDDVRAKYVAGRMTEEQVTIMANACGYLKETGILERMFKKKPAMPAYVQAMAQNA